MQAVLSMNRIPRKQTMTKYVVEPAAHPNSPDRPMLKVALQSLTNLVEQFANPHEGKVKILNGAWINTILSIETDQQTADELSRLPGIGKVDRVRPLKGEP
jgi:hypothetical protein